MHFVIKGIKHKKSMGNKMSDFKLDSGQKIVLIGDSITDCGRLMEFAPLGNGYVSIIANLVTSKYPNRRVEWVNKGISGDIVQGLMKRWKEDVINEKPDWISIAIGINNVAQDYFAGGKIEVSLHNFESFYRKILELTKKETTARIIMFEIFYISTEDQSGNNLNIDPYNKIIHKLASEYSAILIPIQSAFCDAKKKRQNQYWTSNDGVHPLPVGHTLIALTFLEEIGF
jgi:lysophospholipase L1-like esterase